MAQDKQLSRIEAKLDALLEESGVDPADFGESGGKAPARQPRQLTAAEQQAIDNAPKHIEAKVAGATPPTPPAPEQAPAPSTPVPSEAVGQVTVVTEQPDGKTTTQTKPVSEVKGESGRGGKA